jgi:hypothetical protein
MLSMAIAACAGGARRISDRARRIIPIAQWLVEQKIEQVPKLTPSSN